MTGERFQDLLRLLGAIVVGLILGHLTSGVGDPLLCSLWRCTTIHVTDGVVHDEPAIIPDMKRMSWPLGAAPTYPLIDGVGHDVPAKHPNRRRSGSGRNHFVAQ